MTKRMHLSEINIYPVKSLAGISLKEAVVEERGLRHDRRWMLVDENRQFITQREVPAMATLKIELNGSQMRVTAGGDSIDVPTAPLNGHTANVKIWSSSVKALVYDDDTDRWLSDMLGVNCRLVLMPEDAKRKVNPDYAVRRFQDTVSFADGYPFLLIGEGSLADLNSRLKAPVPMNRFRPNFVVSDAEPFAEDTWKKIRIGETVFHLVKPSERCVMTTIDQVAGEKDGKEPLATLSSYRKRDGKVLFGQNLIAETAGATVKVGDTVEVIEAR